MNELIAVIYYCLHSDQVVDKKYLEAEVFACFVGLMGYLSERFVRDSDNEEMGLFGKCKMIEQIVKS